MPTLFTKVYSNIGLFSTVCGFAFNFERVPVKIFVDEDSSDVNGVLGKRCN